MTDVEILEKALKQVEEKYKVHLPMPMDKVVEYGIYYKLIFDHAFAKALWGDVFVDGQGRVKVYKFKGKGKKLVISGMEFTPAYLHHLKKMVVMPNPIKYLEKFV